MYGGNSYGLEQYGEHNKEEETERYFVDLTRYVPPFLAEIKELKQIYNAEGAEFGILKYRIEDLLKQFFVATATWGLVRWEQDYGIETNLEQPLETRREVITAKIRGTGTATKQMLKNAAEAFSGGEVDIIEDNANYQFTVQFIGVKGIPKNLQVFKNLLEDIKPAHLAYEFTYTYSIWEFFRTTIWGSLKEKHWDELKTYDTRRT